MRHHQIGDVIVDRADQKNHPLLEQAGIDIVGALPAPAGFYYHRNQTQILRQGVLRCIVMHHQFFSINSLNSRYRYA